MSPSIVLKTWENARQLSGPERGVALLSMFRSSEPVDALLSTPIAERDRVLLAGRSLMFGDEIETVARCEGCGEQVELGFRISDVQPGREATAEPSVIEVLSRRFLVRLPNTRDLINLRAVADPRERAAALIESCVQLESGEAVESPRLDREIHEAVSREIEQRSPAADIRMSVQCDKCAKRWDAVFDIATFLWEEIETWAVRVLGEVHALATAYGWTEEQILALTPWRRALYLKMVRGC